MILGGNARANDYICFRDEHFPGSIFICRVFQEPATKVVRLFHAVTHRTTSHDQQLYSVSLMDCNNAPMLPEENKRTKERCEQRDRQDGLESDEAR